MMLWTWLVLLLKATAFQIRIDSPRALLAVLPPEAEEFFQALDEWADSNSRATAGAHPSAEPWDNSNSSSSILEELILDTDAPFLSTEDYLDLSRKSLGLDPEQFEQEQQPTEDSFRNGLFNYISRESVVSTNDDNLSEEEALELFLDKLRHKGRHAANYFNQTLAEELDRQVFAEEIGHQRSSALFRSSLTNETVREDAIHERRTRHLKHRQAEQAANLDRLLNEFMEETVWDDESDDLGLDIAHCSVCQRMLTASESEVCSQCKTTEQHSEQEDDTELVNAPRSSPWIKTIDPDTNEAFYWNQDTEEMRWEAPAYSDEFE